MRIKLQLFKLVQIFILVYAKLIRKISNIFFRDRKTDIIIVLKKLGDTVFTIPAIKQIISKDKNRKVILCFESNSAIIKSTVNCELVVIKPDDLLFSGRCLNFKTLLLLNKLYPNKCYDLTGNSLSASVLLFLFVPTTLGFNEKKLFKNLYTEFTELNNKPHLVAMYLRVTSPEMSDTEMDSHWQYPANVDPDGKILIHPFAGWKAKEWGLNKFYNLSKNLKSKNFDVVVVFQEGEMDEEVIDEFRNIGITTAATSTVEDLIELIEHSSIIVGNDSAAVQIGKLLGKPTFTICGPTHPRFYAAGSDKHGYIFGDVPCSPGFNDQYCFTFAGRRGCPAFQCMDNMSISAVENKLLQFLNNIGYSSEVYKNV